MIESGDLFSGIRLSWAEGTYVIDTLLTIKLDPDNMPLFSWRVLTKDIELYRASGESLQLDDFIFYCSHCTGLGGGTIWWQHADTLNALIGKQTLLDLPCIGNSAGGLSGTILETYDELDWISGCTHCSVSIDCGPCPWDVQNVIVHVTVPPDVDEGTIDKIRIIPAGPCCFGESTSVYVRAVPGIGTEETSWGRIKSRMKTK